MMLTGGEKYNTKKIIVKISDIYPNIKNIISNEKYANSDSNLNALYNYSLEIFKDMYTLSTTNIINSNANIAEIFNLMQKVYSLPSVHKSTKEDLIALTNKIPTLQEELINLVESDTTNRDAVLRQIMDELGIVDPNAKKKKSLW